MTAPFAGRPGDPYESKQDVAELNTCTLIGCTDERGDAWHRRDDLMGDESNHYPGLIPLEDLPRRLFTWYPQRAEVAYLVPFRLPEDVRVDDDGSFYRFVDGEGNFGSTVDYTLPNNVILTGTGYQRVVRTQSGRVGVLRDDNDYDLGVFGSGAQHPPYQVTLIEKAERLVGTQLGVSSAGVLAKGARAWVEFSLPQTCHDGLSGFDYRPNLVMADSMDGSISLTSALTVEATVCMNTLRWNLLEASTAGTLFRRKHTANIVSGKLDEERQVLGILEQVDRTFAADLRKLTETVVTARQKIRLMDIIVPLTEDMTPRSKQLAEIKRDRLMAWDSSPMVHPWLGTGLGELQRYNTDQHWGITPKGTGRWERNKWRDIMGKSADSDRLVLAAMEEALA